MNQQKLKASPSIIFGPVPSRRFGRSLGINNIPPKICTYSCAYCQLGGTKKLQIERQAFYEPEYILHAVQDKIATLRNTGEQIDYLTFVPDGEPTLDINMGKEIDLLKSLDIPIAVITNASLIWQRGVRNALMNADCVSLKFDTVEEAAWRRINRPHSELKLDLILEGAREFVNFYHGRLITETMILAQINDTDQNIVSIADYLASIQPAVAYLSIPIRPPAEKWVQLPSGDSLNRAYQILKERLSYVEYLTSYEGNDFTSSENIEENILSVTAVHPMRDDALNILLRKSGIGWEVIHRMMMRDQLIETEYMGHRFYLRKFGRHGGGKSWTDTSEKIQYG